MHVVFFLSSCTWIIAFHLDTLDARRVELNDKVGAEPEDGVLVDGSRRWTDGPDVHDQRKMLAKRVSSN